MTPETQARKSEWIHVKASPEQKTRIETHCQRLHSSMAARILELLRRDVLAHSHFDLSFELGPVRRPRRTA